ncbi:MAG: zinc-ribbon domain-containing protein [Oscillospiraceae bacterium]
MQKCYNCGKEVDDNVLICPECGALVRRYTKPVQQIPEPENVPPRSAAYPGAYETPAQESLRERVWLDAVGKPHLNGALCFWLIVCAVFTAYLVVAFGCVAGLSRAVVFLETLESFPEFSDMRRRT